MKVAIVVGHSEKSQGAVNASSGMTEFLYNKVVAVKLALLLEQDDAHEGVIIYRDNYINLPAKVNRESPDVILSLHCNAFNKKAKGCETLYYHRSKRSKALARMVNKEILWDFDAVDRGIKARQANDRGSYLLRMTDAPCVIVEPFFIDNDDDYDMFQTKQGEYAMCLAEAIDRFDNYI